MNLLWHWKVLFSRPIIWSNVGTSYGFLWRKMPHWQKNSDRFFDRRGCGILWLDGKCDRVLSSLMIECHMTLCRPLCQSLCHCSIIVLRIVSSPAKLRSKVRCIMISLVYLICNSNSRFFFSSHYISKF